MIVNGISGTGHSEERLEELRTLFAEAGLDADFIQAKKGDDLGQLARDAMARQPSMLVAGGGDGTINTVADLVRNTQTTLGVLPLGTLHHFAKDLGIPTDLAGAVKNLAEGERRPVDVGEVNGTCFLNNSSLGIYPGIVRDRVKQQRRLGRAKYVAMAAATFSMLKRAPAMKLRLETDDEAQHCVSPFVFVGNNCYEMQGFSMGSRPSLDQGELSIYTTRRCTAGGLIGLFLRALMGRLEQAEDFSAMTASTLRVQSRHKRLLVATDGEVKPMETPLEYRILPKSLYVMAPRPTES